MDKKLSSLEILFVEDEKEIQEYFKEIFEYFFKTVHIASDGQEALNIYHTKNISAIFTDYIMPKLDGYELTVQIRKIDKNIPITIISNFDDRDKLQRCIPLGLMGYLFKPLRYEDIKEYIKTHEKKILQQSSLEYKISQNSTINFSNHTLKIEEEILIVTKLESKFLELMIENKNMIVTYDTIFEYLYNFEPSFSTIKNLVYRLKTKYKIDMIKNIKDIGYILVKND